MHHYLAIFCDDPCRHQAVRDTIKAALADLDIHIYSTSRTTTIFTTRDAPVMALPDGGVVFGQLYTQDSGRRMEFDAELQHGEHVRDTILRRSWGEYVLFQQTRNVADALLVMRDPSGAIPCVYSIQDELAFVTSDITLAARTGFYSKQIDWSELPAFLAFPHIKVGATALSGVQELLPGCIAQFQQGRAFVTQEWSPWDFVTPGVRYSTLEEAANEVRSSVSIVVKAWSRFDSSILLELSGGIDSSIVGTCLADSRSRITCCTLVPPVPGADERQYATLIAKKLSTELVVEDLPLDDAKFEFSLPPHSVLPRVGFLQHAIDTILQSAADRHGAKTFYSGGGGDTVFSFLRTAAPAADALRSGGIRAAMTAVGDLSELHKCTRWKAGVLTCRKLFRGPRDPYRAITSFLADGSRDGSHMRHPWLDVPAGTQPGDAERVLELAGTQGFRDGAPRAAVRALRLPLLSQPVMEACLRVPSWMWISQGVDRSVARTAFSKELPQEILRRRSKGTFLGYLGAVYMRNRPHIRELLLDGKLRERGLLDVTQLETFLRSTLSSRDHGFTRIFDLCMVENWVRNQD